MKANVLFFDRKPASETHCTRELWVYDLRTNQHFTLKQNPLRYEYLQDFVAAYAPEDRRARALRRAEVAARRTNACTRYRLIAAISARWYRIRLIHRENCPVFATAQLEPFDVGDLLISFAEDL